MGSIRIKYWKLIIPGIWLFFGLSIFYPASISEAQNTTAQPADSIRIIENQSDTQVRITRVEDSVTSKPQETKETDSPEQATSNKSREPHSQINKLILQFYGEKNLGELKDNLIIYGNKHFPTITRNLYIRIIEKTYTYPIIFLFIMLILFFILSVNLVLLVLYYTNNRMNRNERYNSIYRNLYEDIFRSYLFGEINWEKASKKLKKVKTPRNRKIITEVLINFKENLRGEMDSIISEIFVKLGLHKDSLKLAKSSFYFRKVQGVRELTILNPEGALEIIPNYLNNSHSLVRTESQVSYVRLHPEKPFGFLRTLTYPFSRWTQISTFYIFRLHQLPVPSFVDYLDSRNANVRNFCLRMIIFFQQIENASEIFKLLESKVESTRFLSIKAINDLRLFDGKNLIKELYHTETEINKTEIIKALKNIGNNEDFDFLESIIQSDSVSLKTEACRSLYYINNQGKERLISMNQNPDLEIDKYLAHITDPRN